MEIIFLGYADYNFDSNDGNHIDGIKFFYFFQSTKSNYKGFEVGGIFVPRTRNDQISEVQKCIPLQHYRLNMGYDGRKAVFLGLDLIKAA